MFFLARTVVSHALTRVTFAPTNQFRQTVATLICHNDPLLGPNLCFKPSAVGDARKSKSTTAPQKEKYPQSHTLIPAQTLAPNPRNPSPGSGSSVAGCPQPRRRLWSVCRWSLAWVTSTAWAANLAAAPSGRSTSVRAQLLLLNNPSWRQSSFLYAVSAELLI
jgi:hypothetical protein